MRHSLPNIFRPLALLAAFVFLSAQSMAGLGLPDTLIQRDARPRRVSPRRRRESRALVA